MIFLDFLGLPTVYNDGITSKELLFTGVMPAPKALPLLNLFLLVMGVAVPSLSEIISMRGNQDALGC